MVVVAGQISIIDTIIREIMLLRPSEASTLRPLATPANILSGKLTTPVALTAEDYWPIDFSFIHL